MHDNRLFVAFGACKTSLSFRGIILLLTLKFRVTVPHPCAFTVWSPKSVISAFSSDVYSLNISHIHMMCDVVPESVSQLCCIIILFLVVYAVSVVW